RVRPVRGGEEEQGGRRDVEIGAQLAALDALAKKVADPFLVAAPLGDEPRAPVAGEVAPLAHEDGRDVELTRDDGEVGPQREPDTFRRRRVGRYRVESFVERLRALPRDRPEQVFLGRDVVVERRL